MNRLLRRFIDGTGSLIDENPFLIDGAGRFIDGTAFLIDESRV